MSNKSCMCEQCRIETKYYKQIRCIEENIDDVSFTYSEEYALCIECNNEVYVGEIHDRNLYNYNEEYKKSIGIITIEKIQKILDKYNIGKKPLSILMGWGETTIIRYINGDFPNEKYSEILSRILEDENYMLIKLEENKEKITELAYRKCKNSIMEHIRDSEVSIVEVSKYIISRHDVTPKALQKILYFIQGFNMAFNKRIMFNNIAQAWVHGPVYPEIYNYYSDFKYNTIDIGKPVEDLKISESQNELINCILRFFTKYSGDVLEKITHIESPWMNARIGLSKNQPSRNDIDLEEMKKYFLSVINKYNMINYYDIKQYLDDMLNKIDS